MNPVLGNVLVVAFFILLGSVFVAAELALVSVRESQTQRLAETGGRRGHKLAELQRDPNRFLAAVQVGVTLTGFVSAGFGAAEIAPQVQPWLVALGLPEQLAGTVAFIVVTLVIAYFSLVIGELVPKRLALQNAERISLAVAPGVDLFSKVMRPVVWLLSRSTDLVVRLLGGDPTASREEISGEELRGMVASHTELTAEERELIDDVFEAGDRELREVMVPRTEVEFLDASLPVFRAAKVVADQPHSRYPVITGSPDEVVGFVHVRDILAPDVVERGIRVGELARQVAMFPGTKAVIPALTEMRRLSQHLAIVVDEYGGTAGIVTMEDLVEELVGDIRDEYDVRDEAAGARSRDDVDGLLNLDDFEEETGVALPEGPYETVAGFIVARLGRLPEVGAEVEVDGHRLVVTELDGRRVARLRLDAAPTTAASDPTEG